MSPRSDATARSILDILAVRLSAINLDDTALTGVTLIVNIASGRARSVVMRPEYRDDVVQATEYVDSCGPVRRR